MNKENIEKKKRMLKDFSEKGQGQRVFFEEDLELIRDILQHLEQKESILDKVTEYTENYIDNKQNEYEAISESYICQTDEDEYIKEKELAIIKGQKQVLKNVLNIIEGEKK